MYLNFKEIISMVVKCLIYFIIIVLLFILEIFNYRAGISFCDVMKMPYDFAITPISSNMTANISIIMFVIEIIILFYIIKIIKK